VTTTRKLAELSPAVKAISEHTKFIESVSKTISAKDLLSTFRPFLAAQKAADTISQATKVADLGLAFQPFVASGAVAQMSRDLGTYGSVADRFRTLPSGTLESLTAMTREVEGSRRAQDDLMARFRAADRRKVQIEQAAIDNAQATADLVGVGEKQEAALESVARLLGQLVQEQHQFVETEQQTVRSNRRRVTLGIALTAIATAAAVTNLIVNWPR
jgi:hypothetical protein